MRFSLPAMKAYQLTLSDGFIAYLGTKDARPAQNDIVVSGATYTYDPENGRLTIKKVTGSEVSITGPYTSIEQTGTDTPTTKIIRNGQILILKDGKTYNTLGIVVD